MSGPVSVWKYSLGAVGLVVLLNIVLRCGVKLDGMSVNVGIAAGVGILLGSWFAKSVGRVPLSKERSSSLWHYGTPIAIFHVFVGFMAFSINKLKLPGIFVLFLSFIVYPAFAQLFLSVRRVAGFLST